MLPVWRLTSRLVNHEPSNVAGNRVPYLQIDGEHIGGTRTIRYSTVQYSTVQYSTAQYSTAQYSTAPPCRPPFFFLRQGGHPPVDPPPGYTRKYQDTHTRARTVLQQAVRLLRQGGHPPVDPPIFYEDRGDTPLSTPRLDILYTQAHTTHILVPVRYCTSTSWGRRRAQRRGKNFVQSNDYEYEKCILIPEDYFGRLTYEQHSRSPLHDHRE